MTLQPCASCRRHIASDARCCPFCGDAVIALAVASPRRTVGRLSRAAVFAGLAGCWTGSQSAVEPPPPPPGDTPTIPTQRSSFEGTVTELGSNVPLRYATVELRDATGVLTSVNTDEEGRYRFTDIPPGEYHVVVRYSTGSESGTAQQAVTVRDEPDEYNIAVPVNRPAPMPMPYGAPPARRRIV